VRLAFLFAAAFCILLLACFLFAAPLLPTLLSPLLQPLLTERGLRPSTSRQASDFRVGLFGGHSHQNAVSLVPVSARIVVVELLGAAAWDSLSAAARRFVPKSSAVLML
jgi:hypothetical protein